MFIKYLISFLPRYIRTDYRLFHNMGCLTCQHQHYCTSSDITAGIVIIGDEILKGITDVNTPFFIRQLNEINFKICKVAIVGDDINAIAEEVCELSSKCSYVFTSGGIGPTHDDVTYEAIAKACKDELQLNIDLFNLVVNYFGPESKENAGAIKYACIPKSAVVNYTNLIFNNKNIKYPIVSVNNIYMFPGVPILLQKSFHALKYKFVVRNQINFIKNIYIGLDEFTVIKILNECVLKFKNVKFGSYPTFSDNYYKIKLTLESPFEDKIEEASKHILQQLPENSIVNVINDILSNSKNYVYSLSQNSSKVLFSISVIEEAMKNYSLSELCLCFNGGKDSTALLHLLYACIQKLIPKEWKHIQVLYIKNGECFEEVEHFIDATVKLYNFQLTTLEGDIKQTMSYYLEMNKNIKAMIMGTRKGDSGASNLTCFSSTHPDRLPIIQILPILSWSYSDVWYFIRKLQLPYCTLYDRGYTSLGVKSQTIQNPALLLHGDKSFQSYKPAYMLEVSESERKGCL